MGAKVTLRGYVSEKPAPGSRKSAAGNSYNTFQLAVKTGKDKSTGKNKYSYFSCRDMRAGAGLPKTNDYLELTGGFAVSQNEKDGKTYTNLDVFVDELTVSPPRDGQAQASEEAPKSGAKESAAAKEPWED